MSRDELLRLWALLREMLLRGERTGDIEAWADAYYFRRRDLIDLLRLLLDEAAGG